MAISSTSRFNGPTTFGGIGSIAAAANGNYQRRGRAIALASYSATPEVDHNNRSSTLKINSISAMPIYEDTSHEELRFEDYESRVKGSTFSFQNKGNAFQQSNCQFGPSTVPVPSSQFTFCSTHVSDFSAKSQCGSTGKVFGVSPPFTSGGSIGNIVDQAPRNTGAPSSIFGVPNVPTFGPPSASSSFQTSIFGVPSSSVFEASNMPSFQVSTTPGFGVRPTPSFWSTSTSVSSTLSGPQSNSNPFKSNPSPPKSHAFIYPNTTVSSTFVNPFSPQSQAFSPHATPNNSTSLNPFPPQSQAISSHTIPNSTSPNPFPRQSQAFRSHTIPNSTYLNPFLPQSQPFSPHTTPNSASLNPFSPQSQAFSPHTTVVSSMPIFTPSMNPSASIPLSVSTPANNCQWPKMSLTFASPVSIFSSSKPSSTVSPSMQFTSITGFGPWSSIPNASQTIEKEFSFSTTNLSQPSQEKASSGLTTVTEFDNQNLNGPQDVSSTAASMQPSLVANHFATRSSVEISSGAVTSIQHGISSIPVSNKGSRDTRASLMRIRHVSLRHKRLPAQRHNYQSSDPKVPFFSDQEDRPCLVAPFLPRENPRACFTNSLSGQDHTTLPTYTDSKETSIQEEDSSARVNKTHDDVLSLMPKLPDGEYYMEPSIPELMVKERASPGYLSHVKNFVVGRQGYGSIKFFGDTDIRGLNLESIVRFNNREVIVYVDDRKKPAIGESLNKPAEVTLLNVICISKKSGRQYVDGPQIQSYKEMLIKKGGEQGAEFVSYDPVRGEWKFRVQHF